MKNIFYPAARPKQREAHKTKQNNTKNEEVKQKKKCVQGNNLNVRKVIPADQTTDQKTKQNKTKKMFGRTAFDRRLLVSTNSLKNIVELNSVEWFQKGC